jgi:uncharacterized protein DUF5681
MNSQETPMYSTVNQQESGLASRFQKGRSGNPAGRKPGSRNKSPSEIAQQMIASKSKALVQRAIDTALSPRGSPAILVALLRTIVPNRREASLGNSEMIIKQPTSIEEAKAILSDIAIAVASGQLESEPARVATSAITAWIQAHEASQLEERLAAIETRLAQTTNFRRAA